MADLDAVFSPGLTTDHGHPLATRLFGGRGHGGRV